MASPAATTSGSNQLGFDDTLMKRFMVLSEVWLCLVCSFTILYEVVHSSLATDSHASRYKKNGNFVGNFVRNFVGNFVDRSLFGLRITCSHRATSRLSGFLPRCSFI